MNSAASKKLGRLTAALMLSVSCAAVDRAEATCDQITSTATPINNTTVNCSGTTQNQNDPNGWGTGVETGNTINVQGTLSGFGSGISVDTGNKVINSSAISGAVVDGIRSFGSLNVTNSTSGIISGGDGGIFTNLSRSGAPAALSVDNNGTITSNGEFAIRAQGDIAVRNIGDGTSAGIIRATAQNGIAIDGINVNVTGNAGTIEAGIGIGITGGVAIKADTPGGTANITTSGTIQASSIAIVTDGLLTLNNTGLVTAGGAFAAVSTNGDVTVNNGNATTPGGTISAPAGIAIQAAGTATVSNFGDGVTTGIISGDTSAIKANTVIVTGNTGLIEATGANGIAIDASGTGGTANITSSGNIQASSVAIVTNGLLTLNNAGSVASGGLFAVVSNSGDVSVTNSGTIRADNGTAIQAGGQATVSNAAGATISGATDQGGLLRVAGAIATSGQLTLNNAGLVISGGGTFAVQSNNADVNIINSGTIRADNGTAIQAGGTAHVTNLSGGNITAGGTAISAILLDVTNAQGATISGGANGISGSGTVTNAGTLSGNTASVSFGGTVNNKLILQTGSVLNGDAIGALGVTNDLVLQGHGIVANNFLNFTSLDVQADTAWTWNSSANFGTTTITSGTLAVDGTLISPVTVSVGSTLAGRGTVIDNVMVNGAIAPGAVTPLSTLTVAGNVTFNTGSMYRVNVNAGGQNDKLTVTGALNTATLSGGTVNVQALNGVALSVPYTILSAEGGLGGTAFAGVASNLIFLKPTLTTDANDVFLTFNPAAAGPGGSIGFANVAQTRNQIAVAGALDASPATNPLVVALLNQTSVAGTLQAFDALSGEVFGSVHNVQTGQMQFTRSAMLGRMRQASYYGAPGELGALSFGGPELAYADGSRTASAADVGAVYAADFPAKAVPGKATPATRGPSRDLTFWAQGLGGWAHADSDGNAASLKSRFGGFLSGADARFGDAWRAGLVAGYMRTDLNVADRSSSAGIDSVQFGGYAGGKLGAFNVRGGASYSYDSIDTSRAIFFPGFTDKANAHFHGNVGQVFGEVGYGMTLGSVAVEPLAGLAYVHVHDGSFAEAGGLAVLSSASAHESTGYSTLGVRAATAVPLANGTVLVPRGSVQWQHAFGDVTPVNALAFQSTGASFTVAGIPIARNAALVEGGFDWRFSPRAKLGAFYQGELAAHAESHAFKGAFTWDF